MQKIVRGILILISFTLILSGCSGTRKKQVEAIEKAFGAERGKKEVLNYLDYGDLDQQIKEIDKNSEKSKEKDKADYKIKVSILDIKSLEEDVISLTAPSYDLNSINFSTFTNQLLNDSKDKLNEYLLNNDSVKTIEKELDIHLEKQDKEWKATFKTSEIDKISTELDSAFTQKANDIAHGSDEYKRASLASSMNTKLSSIFMQTSYVNSVTIDSIEKAGEGFAVTISYPAPNELYSIAYDEMAKYYKKQGKKLFNKITDTTLSSNLGTYITSGYINKVSKKNTSTIHFTNGVLNTQDHTALNKKINDVKLKKMKKLAKVINSKYVIKALSKPSTSVISGSSSGQPLTISLSGSSPDTHLTFYKLSGTSLDEKGKETIGVFMRSGSSITISLPAGNYKYIGGTGDKWYGHKISFGPDGNYQQSNTLIELQYGYQYTLDLGIASGGNVPTKGITYPY